MPWLERVHQAGSLWDAGEMGAPADVHCYTPAELERTRERRSRPSAARREHGVDLLAPPARSSLSAVAAQGSRSRDERPIACPTG